MPDDKQGPEEWPAELPSDSDAWLCALLQFTGERLDPAELIPLIPLTPMRFNRKGEPALKPRPGQRRVPKPVGSCLYSTDGRLTSPDINDHIAYLLAALQSRAAEIAALRQAQGVRAVMTCYFNDRERKANWNLSPANESLARALDIEIDPEEEPRVHASLGFIGAQMNPDHILPLVPLEAFSTGKAGELAVKGPVEPGVRVARIKFSGCFYSTSRYLTSLEINDHIAFLLAALQPRADEIAALRQAQGFRIEIACFFSDETRKPTWQISPANESLARALGVEIENDIAMGLIPRAR